MNIKHEEKGEQEMPNYCENFLSIEGNADTLKEIMDFVKSDKSVFDFEKIVPMPDYIYRGAVGAKEKEIYGENNWYDWSNKNWGTKWNSVDAEDWDDEIQFLTAWSPCDPVIAALAKMFPMMRFTYTFYEAGMCFCGKRVYENGEISFYYDGDYAENPLCDDDDEWAEDYIISDPLFPIKESGFREEIQDVEEVANHANYIRGKLHYREYDNNKIRYLSSGVFIAIKGYTFQFAEEQVPSNPHAA